MPLSDKISNIIGVTLPSWVLKQLRTRSQQTSKSDKRSNDNLVYLENKTAWIRLVSSVNTPDKSDQKYFSDMGINIQDETSLAKNYVLFGGTSKYLNKNSYQLRSGISNVTAQKSFDGQYGMLGENEINKYGFRPMPGITSVNIETQGRLGSIRQATINFKCWDKMQLDIIDTLYFKLGYTAFLEWGHTYFYDSSNNLQSTELYSIDPFSSDLSKETISYRVAKNNRDSEGNYDAMLGMITNFNFTYNQEGGYDCVIKIIGLGVLAESIKINNASLSPNIYTGALESLNKTVQRIESIQATETLVRDLQDKKAIDVSKITAEELINEVIKYDSQRKKYYSAQTGRDFFEYGTFIYPYDDVIKLSNNNIPQNADVYIQDLKTTGGIDNVIVLRKLNSILFENENVIKKVQLDADRVLELIQPENELGINLKNKDNGWPGGELINLNVDFDSQVDFISISNQRPYTIRIRTDNDLKATFLKVAASNDEISQNVNGTVERVELASGEYENVRLQVRGLFSVFEDTKQTEENLSQIVDSLYTQIRSNTYWPLESVVTDIKPEGGINRNLPAFKVIVDAFINKPAYFQVYYVDQFNQKKQKRVNLPATYKIPFEITFNDTSLIKSFQTEADQFRNSNSQNKDIKNQDQVEIPGTEDQDQQQAPSPEQTEDPLKSASTIELILRAIQTHTLDKAIEEQKNKELKSIQKIDLTTTTQLGEVAFYKKIFSGGIFEPFLKDLIDQNISDEGYRVNESNTFQVNSKYGFATNLLSGFNTPQDFQPVNFKELLSTYVIPYKQGEDLKSGSPINYPVYITLGNLLMIVNSNCSLYEFSKDVKRPVVYVDFNPNHNFCLSNPQQLSIDPWKCMIPFQGEGQDYAEIFPPEIIVRKENTSQYYIKNIDSGSQPSELFTPVPVFENNGDRVSDYLPKYKYENDSTATSSYRGKIMNVLLNIDNLVEIVRDSSIRDEEYKVFLKQFIEKILVDINRSLGNINELRLSYNDAANCLQIVDDQIVPSTGQSETQLERFTPTTDCELPLLGKSTIAKSLEIKTEVTTRLANMIAISANANAAKNAGGTDAESFGFINTKYTDRYIPDRTLVNSKNQENTDGNILAASQFNETVKSVYGIKELSKTQTDGAVNYYLERLSEVRSNTEYTRASKIIPVSVNFKTHGIAGMAMGHAFKIPEELLPYTYSTTRILPYTDRIFTKVGFVIVGLNHTIEGNTWDTSVRANMIFLKDNSTVKSKPKTNRPPREEDNVEPLPYVDPLNAYTKNQIEKTIKSKRYLWYDNAVNIVGVRNSSTVDPISKLSRVTNLFDDKIIVVLKELGDWKIYQWDATTDPGLKAEQQIGLTYRDPITGQTRTIAQNGLAIMKPGQYVNSYSFGFHKNKYRALVQTGPVTVYRDIRRDKFFETGVEQTGLFGINIHKAGVDSTYVENWSEGCQVFKREADFNLFLSILQKSGQNRFTYTLIESSDIS